MTNKGNMGTYQALKKALAIYKKETTLFTKIEFAIWANYFHYLEEQCLEVDIENRLKWMEYYENPPKTLKDQPCKLVTWKCPSKHCSGPGGDLRNLHKICPYCLQAPPACIKWLVDHNPTKMFSHVFAIRGSLKEEDGNWVKDKTWLRDHCEEYDASYQEKEMTEQEHVEHLHHLQHARVLLELREKTQDTMRGVVKWIDPYTGPVCKEVNKYVIGQYEPKVKNSRTQGIRLVQLVVGTYKTIEIIANTNWFVARLTPMRIEHALLHPVVNGPTRARKMYNA
jgi:hypothetical protein